MSPLLKPSHLRPLLQLSRFLDRLTEKVGKLIDWLVLLTIATGFYNVMARYIGRFLGIKLSSNALIEFQWYLFSLTFFLGFAYILNHGENVRVDILYNNWSEKRRAWVDLLGTVLFLIPFCILGLWVTFNPVLLSWGHLPDGSWGTWEVSPDADGLPRAPIKTAILLAFLLLLAQSVSQAIKYLAILMDYPQIAQELREETAESERIPLE